MQTLDLVLIVLLALAAVSGWRRGFAVVVLGYAGLLGGLALGAWMAARVGLVLSVQDSIRRLLIGLIVFFLVASICHVIGIRLGTSVRDSFSGRWLDGLDNLGGAVVACAVVAISLWFVALLLRDVPVSPLARAVNESVVLRTIDRYAPRPPGALAELRRLLDLSPFPDAFDTLREPEHVGPPPVVASNARIARAQLATVQIQSRGCGGLLFGSGFPVQQNLVVTNAHVVAGSAGHQVITARRQRLPATVVYFDPKRDLALLRVPNLRVGVLAVTDASPGMTGAVIGYPGGSDEVKVFGARIKREVSAVGRDIYSRARVVRQIYVLSARIRKGDSGGPLVNGAGKAVGVVFAASTIDGNEGYALTSSELEAALAQSGRRDRAVSVGACAE